MQAYLPVLPTLRVDDSTVRDGHQELASLILDVDEAVDEVLDVLNCGNLQT
jgi:hypothetical protein